ncbi:MAG: D-alanyl-D-alanine carboxypeptidase/D-alanyl-D-alanine-endopeptidase [Nitrospinaceae bacterium]
MPHSILSAASSLLIFWITLAPAWSQPIDESPAAQRFRKKVNSLLSSACLDPKGAGVLIASPSRGEALVRKNSRRPFIPASNMKMVTTAAALKLVGPDYRFYTRLYTPAKVAGRILRGDLYLKGFGDPFLVTEQMWLLVNQLKHLPVDRIEGDVYVDDSYFGGQAEVPGWSRYSGPEPYLAPLGALSFNFNTVTVHVGPGPKVGAPPQVVVQPMTDYIRVRNTARTVPRSRRSRLIVNRHPGGGYDQITVSGKVSTDRARKTFYLNIPDPAWHAGYAFLHFLRQAGVEVTGALRRGTVPAGARQLVEHASPPFASILQGLNKYSNNFMAEQILRTLAAQEFGPPGTTQNGVRLLRRYMESLGYGPEDFVIEDGSGLSRDNRLTPEQIVSVLMDAQKDLTVYPEFISALAIMGVDGSVDGRMKKVAGAARIRAKTGTLNQVSALSGYFQSQDREVFAFSILMNGLKCSNGRAQRLQDALLAEALKFSRKEGPASAKVMVKP